MRIRKIEKGQTTQWSKEKFEDTKIVFYLRLPITILVSSNFSFDHCVVCPFSIYKEKFEDTKIVIGSRK
jgi:hypothetical protein